MKYDAILMALPNLNKKQLTALRATIDHLLHNEVDHNDPTIELFTALTIVLGIQRMSYEAFSKTAMFKTWRKNSPGCLEFINETWPEAAKSKILGQALMVFLLNIQKDSIKRWGVPVTLNSMINALVSLKANFDFAFPGYIESGMSFLILDGIKGVKHGHKAKPTRRK